MPNDTDPPDHSNEPVRAIPASPPLPQDWGSSYKGYGIEVGRHFHGTHQAHYTITKLGPDGAPVEVHHGTCEGTYDDADQAAFAIAYAAARAYIDTLPSLDA